MSKLGSASEAGRVLLVYGNPVDGFTYIGPVAPNDPEVDEFIDAELRGTEWWYVPVQTLSEAREESA